MINERLSTVFDNNMDGYLNSEEFVHNLLQFYSSDFSRKLKLVFRLYDFDDDYILKEDVRLLLSYVPIKSSAGERQEERRLTFEGAGTEEFIDRVQSQFEIDTLLDIYFEGDEKLNFEKFSKAMKDKASEIFICLYSVLKSNLPSLVNLKRTVLSSKKGSSRALHSTMKDYKVAVAKVLNKFVPTSEIVKS
jgi:Ca2+-binding EF-hand superfamily protein